MTAPTHQPDYPGVDLFIGGRWRPSADGATDAVANPATGEPIGRLAHATIADLNAALAAADAGFRSWQAVSAFDRYKIIREAARLLRERVERIARWMTLEQGKPLAQARLEVLAGADIVDWFAEEGRRAYGSLIPPRAPDVRQMVIRGPVGPVAAFTPWNFPINQVVRKVSAALAAGCSIIVKGPEETPASPAELIRCFADAGVSAGAVNLVYGNSAEISGYLIPHPLIRKMSFTGSTAVGKQLAALAGAHMKRVTIELGGHAPVLVLKDADIAGAAAIMAAHKYRNAGQVCVSPTRFLIEQPVYEEFVSAFVGRAQAIKVGDGLAEGVAMGPLANARRVDAVADYVRDAEEQGAKVLAGGKRIGNKGNFFEPTVLGEVPLAARAMNEEPFGPLALLVPVASFDDMLVEANRLNVGLAAYGFTRSAASAARMSSEVSCGMLSINHIGLGLPEVPFGGVNDSGYGSEGGADALDSYLTSKFVSHRFSE